MYFNWLEKPRTLNTDYADEDFPCGLGRFNDEPTLWHQARRYSDISFHSTRTCSENSQILDSSITVGKENV